VGSQGKKKGEVREKSAETRTRKRHLKSTPTRRESLGKKGLYCGRGAGKTWKRRAGCGEKEKKGTEMNYIL